MEYFAREPILIGKSFVVTDFDGDGATVVVAVVVLNVFSSMYFLLRYKILLNFSWSF